MRNENKPGRALISAAQISRRVKELGRRISRDYEGDEITLVGVLKGSVVFLSDLARAIKIPCRVDFMAVTSYSGSESTGAVRVAMDLRENPAGQNILLVEDIVDTGLTLSYLLKALKARRPKSLKVCALLDKPAARVLPVELDYTGFRIPSKFVVGYGLDFNERYRELPYIAALPRGFGL